MGPSVIADLDTLLIALYVELTDRIIPTRPNGRRAGPGRPPALTDAALVCLAVAQSCCATTTNPTGCGPHPQGSGTCTPGCCPSPPTTVGCQAPPGCWRPRCAGWPTTPRPPPSGCGCWTGPRWCAAGRGPPRCVPTLPAGPATATTAPTTASTGAPGCCWSVPPRGR